MESSPYWKKLKSLKGNNAKAASKYPDIKVPVKSIESNMIHCDDNLLAFSWKAPGNSTLCFRQIDKPGRVDDGDSLLKIGSSACHDFAFSPFSHGLSGKSVFATANDSGSLKVYHIPHVCNAASMKTVVPLFTISKHMKRNSTLAWNPFAANIIASGSWDNTVQVFDVNEQKSAFHVKCFDDSILHTVWDNQGTSILNSLKNRHFSIADVRSGKETHNALAHEGPKAVRVCWFDGAPTFITIGFDKYRHRQFKLWDSRNLETPLQIEKLGEASNSLMPFFNPDLGILYLCGKGDSKIHTFNATPGSANHFRPSRGYAGGGLQRGATIARRTFLNPFKSEIDCIFKLTDRCVEPVTFTVPSTGKSRGEYYECFYPDTVGIEASTSAKEFCSGATPKAPKLRSIKPTSSEIEEASSSTATLSRAAMAKRNDIGYGKFHQSGSGKHDRTDLKRASTPTSKSNSFVRQSKFRHVYGESSQKNSWITGLVPAQNTPPECGLIAANSKFFAFITKGKTGIIQCAPLNKPQRMEINVPKIYAHNRPVVNLAWNPFNDYQLVTSGDDNTLKIWTIPAAGITRDIKDADLTLTGHKHIVRCLEFHPTAKNVLATAALDGTLRIWDTSNGEEIYKIDISRDGNGTTGEGTSNDITDISWNRNGSLIAVVRKDQKCLIINPRDDKIVHIWKASSSPKGGKITFCGKNENFVITSTWSDSGREISLWDLSKLNSPQQEITLANTPGYLFLNYDDDLDLLYVSGRGDSSIKILEFDTSKKQLFGLSDFKSKESHFGTALLPKRSCNIMAANVATFVRITLDHVEHVYMYVPRRHKEFFQDDIFPDTASKSPSATVDDFTSGKSCNPKLDSLRPAGKESLSDSEFGSKKTIESTRHLILKQGESVTVTLQDQVRNEFETAVVSHELEYEEGWLPGDDIEGGVPDEEWDQSSDDDW